MLLSLGARGQPKPPQGAGTGRQPEAIGAGRPPEPVRFAPRKKVAYVIVASDALAPRLKLAMIELRKAIDHSLPVDAFNVVLAQERASSCFEKLTPATPENKRKGYEFTDTVKAQGKGALAPALKLAVAQGATELYVLASGVVPDMKDAVQYLRTVNKANDQKFRDLRDLKVKVNTIAFIDGGKELEAALKALADENGGIFRSVRESDLKEP
jgi:hypothetical protein